MCNDASLSESLQIQHLPPRVAKPSTPVYANGHSKQAVGYSKESHLYSDVTAPSPAKISVNAFSLGRFSVQTRCLVRQTRPPRATHKPKGTEARPSRNALINKLGKDISQRLIPVTVHIPGSSPRATCPQSQTRCRRRSFISI